MDVIRGEHAVEDVSRVSGFEEFYALRGGGSDESRGEALHVRVLDGCSSDEGE